MNSTNDNGNPINPIVILPAELFSRLFHFLPVSSTATSMINREWRQVILSDSTLHTEVDLGRFHRWYQMVPIFFHLNRLSNLSLNRLVKVTLNLNAFFEEFRRHEKSQATGLDYLFLTLSNSKASLRTLSLEIKDTEEGITYRPDELSSSEDNIPPFLLMLTDRFEDLPNLRRIEVRSPYMTSFKVGQENVSSTSLSFVSNTLDDTEDGYSVAWCTTPLSRDSAILDRAVDYVGSGICELSIEDPGSFLEEANPLEQLSHSQTTLQKLEWQSHRRAERFFSFAMRCPRLTSLYFSCDMHEDMDDDAEVDDYEHPQEGEEMETWQLDLEEDYLKNPNLKKLHLHSYLNHPRFDWDLLSSWVSGSALEVLGITFPGAMIPQEALKMMLMGSKDSLKEVTLAKIRCKELEASDSWLFPNLESLSLTSIAPALFDNLYMMVAPNLTSLDLKGSYKDEGSVLDHFSKLLKKYETRLTSLSIRNYNEERPSDLPQPFKFLKLCNLDVYDNHLAGLFSKFEYPELVSLNLHRPDWNENYQEQVNAFSRNSPKLSTVNKKPL